MKHKYGSFDAKQISETKKSIRKRIFFLLLIAEDLETKSKFPDMDLYEAHVNLMYLISGFNELLGKPQEIVNVLCRLEEALKIIKPEFDFATYRKLILDAGAEVLKIPESEV